MVKVSIPPLFRRKKIEPQLPATRQLTVVLSVPGAPNLPSRKTKSDHPPACSISKKNTQNVCLPSHLSFSTAFWFAGSGHAKKKTTTDRLPLVCVRCFCRHHVLRPNRETKVFMEAAKSHPFLNKKNQLPKALPSMFIGFHVHFEFLQIINYFGVWKWVEFPVCLGGVPCCPRLFVELLFLKASWWWENIALEGKKSVTISGKEDS